MKMTFRAHLTQKVSFSQNKAFHLIFRKVLFHLCSHCKSERRLKKVQKTPCQTVAKFLKIHFRNSEFGCVNVNWSSGANWPFGYCARAAQPGARILGALQMLNIDSDKLRRGSWVLLVGAMLLTITWITIMMMMLRRVKIMMLPKEWSRLKKHCQRYNGTEGCVQLTKVTCLGHITSSKTDLDQTSSSEHRRSINFKISTKDQHLD